MYDLVALAGSIRHLLGASDFKQKCDLKFSEQRDPGGAVGMGRGGGALKPPLTGKFIHGFMKASLTSTRGWQAFSLVLAASVSE